MSSRGSRMFSIPTLIPPRSFGLSDRVDHLERQVDSVKTLLEHSPLMAAHHEVLGAMKQQTEQHTELMQAHQEFMVFQRELLDIMRQQMQFKVAEARAVEQGTQTRPEAGPRDTEKTEDDAAEGDASKKQVAEVDALAQVGGKGAEFVAEDEADVATEEAQTKVGEEGADDLAVKEAAADQEGAAKEKGQTKAAGSVLPRADAPLLPAPKELAGVWIAETGVEFSFAPRPPGCLHYSTSKSHVAHLRREGNTYTGPEIYWNSDAAREVKLVHEGSKLEFQAKQNSAWSAPWVLRRLSVTEAAARGRYVALTSLWEALADGHTVLLKGSWLLAATELPRRQDLPQGAAWEPDELQRAVEAGAVRIVGLSYCWENREHPDPKGEQLRTVARLIARRLAHSYPDGRRVLEDLAVFWDYSSLFQKPRSDCEEEAFKRGLRSVNLWYAHSCTESWLLTRVPQGSRAYGERGWPVFERAICGLITPQDLLLDVGLWKGNDGPWSVVARECKAKREPPTRPERAAELLRTKHFTNGADLETVRAIYERTYREVLGSVRALLFDRLCWGDDEAKALAECLPDCPQLEELSLQEDRIGAVGAVALGAAAAQCDSLRVVRLSGNPVGDEGATALCAGLANCPTLQRLHLANTGIQDRGAEVIAAALPRFRSVQSLSVNDCKISDVGAAALGSVLGQCPLLEHLEIQRNQLTFEAKEALLVAWLSAGKSMRDCKV